MTDLLEEVKKIVREAWLDGPTAPQGVELDPETRFIEDMIVDSLAIIEMVLLAETAFDIDIPDGEYDHIRTLQDAVDYLERKLPGDVHRKEKDRP